jgi:hypothetical protein
LTNQPVVRFTLSISGDKLRISSPIQLAQNSIRGRMTAAIKGRTIFNMLRPAKPIRAIDWNEIAAMPVVKAMFGITFKRDAGHRLAAAAQGVRLDCVKDKSGFSSEAFVILGEPLIGRALILRRNRKGRLVVVAPPEFVAIQ